MTDRRLDLMCITAASAERRGAVIDSLVIAGWTGRDVAAVRAHIEELARLGVPRPATTPIFYRVAASLLTTAERIQCMGEASSGEVEPVLFAFDDGLWIGVGSDHTDRQAETAGITLAKQLCAKPVAPQAWRFAEVADHWDSIVLRSHATTAGGKRRLYQEGPASLMLRPESLIERYAPAGLAGGTAMFCGTMAAKGEVAPADAFAITMEDPILKRSIHHEYRIEPLPVAG